MKTQKNIEEDFKSRGCIVVQLTDMKSLVNCDTNKYLVHYNNLVLDSIALIKDDGSVAEPFFKVNR